MTKPRKPQSETPNAVQNRDLFQTPNYATRLLIPFIPKNIKYIWECAAGHGKIVTCLRDAGYSVYANDIQKELENVNQGNFLTDFTTKENLLPSMAIITNPPYSLKRKFFEKCIEYDLPFALLISGDYSLWTIDAVRKYNCEKIIPDHRIDFITPSGKSGATGHTSYFHSYWLTRYFGLGKSETFVELTKEMKKNI